MQSFKLLDIDKFETEIILTYPSLPSAPPPPPPPPPVLQSCNAVLVTTGNISTLKKAVSLMFNKITFFLQLRKAHAHPQ